MIKESDMTTKPIWLNMTDDQFQRTVDYFNRRRKDRAVQRSRQLVNERRRDRQTGHERGRLRHDQSMGHR